MRISFLTSQLPPAACGVGDHTKFLAHAMAAQDVEVGFIHLKPLQEGDGGLPTGPVDGWDGSPRGLTECVARRAPDWLWVQLSAYGYSRWGAPYRMGRALAHLRMKLKEVRLAICVHETHCRSHQLGIKGPILSPWQKHTVGKLVRLGDVVFPTIPLWQKWVVKEYRVPPAKVSLLPIGSNIPDVRLTEEQKRECRKRWGWREGEVVLASFGSYGSQLQGLNQFEKILQEGVDQQLLHRIVCMGGDASVIPPELMAWKTRFPPPFHLDILGPRPAHVIGELLACSDFGITPHKRMSLEKSGAFKAYAAAGLAVLSWPDDRSDGVDNPGLPILAAESWDWRDARSPRVAQVRQSIQKHAKDHYRWESIAFQAIERMRKVSIRCEPARTFSGRVLPE